MPTLSSASIIVLLLVAAIGGAAGHYVTDLWWEKRSDDLLEDQEKLLIGQCKDQKKTTKEIDNATLKKMRAGDDRVAEYKRLHPAPTPVPVTGAPGHGNAAGGGSIDGRPHAVTDHALVDYSAIAERYRIQLVGCQDFINRVWESQ